MVDPDKILARIRDHGANVMLDGSKLVIVNRNKLPAGALDFIKANAKAVADALDHEAGFEERAAIIDHDGAVPQPLADQLARLLTASRPRDVDLADWNWFMGKAALIVDRRAA